MSGEAVGITVDKAVVVVVDVTTRPNVPSVVVDRARRSSPVGNDANMAVVVDVTRRVDAIRKIGTARMRRSNYKKDSPR